MQLVLDNPTESMSGRRDSQTETYLKISFVGVLFLFLFVSLGCPPIACCMAFVKAR